MSRILLTYPHSSLEIPDFVKSRLSVPSEDLAIASDLYTEKLLWALDAQRVFAWTHLFFWNLNRNIEWQNFLTKEQYWEHNWMFQSVLLRDGREIYKSWEWLTDEEKQRLLDLYYKPFYKRVHELLDSWNVDFMFDVHSCDPISSGKQAWSWERADIILWNLWDENWEVKDEVWFVTFSPDILNRIKRILEDGWLSVSLNVPFSWWNITQEFWSLKKAQVLQIEVNKRLYLKDDLLTISQDWLRRVDEILTNALRSL